MTITAADLAGLLRRVEEAAGAYVRGDAERYRELIEHAGDYTLMPPYGGEVRRAPGDPGSFRNGEATIEVIAAHASGDLAVLALVERQHGELGDLPDQDLSLRVTAVFRRESPGWRLVHRHADPLVHGISLERTAALLRGE